MATSGPTTPGYDKELQFRRGGIVKLKTNEPLTRQQVADLVPKLAELGLRPTFDFIGSPDGRPDFDQLAAYVKRNWPKNGDSFIGKEHLWYALHLAQHKNKPDKIIKNLADRAMNFVLHPVLVDTQAPYSYYPVTNPVDTRDHGVTIKPRIETGIEPFPSRTFASTIIGQQYREGMPINMVDVAGFVGFSDRIGVSENVKFNGVGSRTIDALHAAADVFRPYIVIGDGLEPPEIIPAD